MRCARCGGEQTRKGRCTSCQRTTGLMVGAKAVGPSPEQVRRAAAELGRATWDDLWIGGVMFPGISKPDPVAAKSMAKGKLDELTQTKHLRDLAARSCLRFIDTEETFPVLHLEMDPDGKEVRLTTQGRLPDGFALQRVHLALDDPDPWKRQSYAKLRLISGDGAGGTHHLVAEIVDHDDRPGSPWFDLIDKSSPPRATEPLTTKRLLDELPPDTRKIVENAAKETASAMALNINMQMPSSAEVRDHLIKTLGLTKGSHQ